SGSRGSTCTQQWPAKNASAIRPIAPPCAVSCTQQIGAATCDTCASSYAQTPLQILEPPAPPMEGALVHAALSRAVGASRLLDAQSAQRDPCVRDGAVHLVRAAPDSFPARRGA